jgi:hypothetical protein
MSSIEIGSSLEPLARRVAIIQKAEQIRLAGGSRSVSELVACVYKLELRRIAFAERPGRVRKSVLNTSAMSDCI